MTLSPPIVVEFLTFMRDEGLHLSLVIGEDGKFCASIDRTGSKSSETDPCVRHHLIKSSAGADDAIQKLARVVSGKWLVTDSLPPYDPGREVWCPEFGSVE